MTNGNRKAKTAARNEQAQSGKKYTEARRSVIASQDDPWKHPNVDMFDGNGCMSRDIVRSWLPLLDALKRLPERVLHRSNGKEAALKFQLINVGPGFNQLAVFDPEMEELDCIIWGVDEDEEYHLNPTIPLQTGRRITVGVNSSIFPEMLDADKHPFLTSGRGDEAGTEVTIDLGNPDKAAQELDAFLAGILGDGPTETEPSTVMELCQRYADGRVTREQVVQGLVDWPYIDAGEFDEFGDYSGPTEGTVRDIPIARHRGLIDVSIYEEVLKQFLAKNSASQEGISPRP